VSYNHVGDKRQWSNSKRDPLWIVHRSMLQNEGKFPIDVLVCKDSEAPFSRQPVTFFKPETTKFHNIIMPGAPIMRPHRMGGIIRAQPEPPSSIAAS